MNRKTRKILTALLSLTFVIGLVGSIFSLLQDREGNRVQQEAEQTAGLHEQAEVAPETDVPDPAFPEDPIAEVMARVDLAALQEVNPVVLGWISIPDTVISYPFLQGEDNDYYLRRTWQGEKNTAGCIFLDSEVSPDFSDFSTIIYGHRMRNETMFGTLKYYEDPAYWQAHPSVYIMTEDLVRRYDIFAAYEAETNAICYGLGISGDKVKQAFLDFALESSVIETGVAVSTEDQILTMSTCPAQGYETRWVVQAVLRQEWPVEAIK